MSSYDVKGPVKLQVETFTAPLGHVYGRGRDDSCSTFTSKEAVFCSKGMTMMMMPMVTVMTMMLVMRMMVMMMTTMMIV